ncbi:carboxymuconolactone decarboxylase family protein [Chitinibacteraceae bacterium HSL-7]
MRINYFTLGSGAVKILMAQEHYLKTQFSQSGSVTVPVWELIKLRVSQINQCAFCIDMHSKEALRGGERHERMLGLSAWRDMPLYSEAERAALEWAEHLTSGQPVDDARFQRAVDALGEQAVVDLTIAVNAINSWNCIVKAFKPEVGSYRPD